jgi:hypothetical protein
MQVSPTPAWRCFQQRSRTAFSAASSCATRDALRTRPDPDYLLHLTNTPPFTESRLFIPSISLSRNLLLFGLPIPTASLNPKASFRKGFSIAVGDWCLLRRTHGTILNGLGHAMRCSWGQWPVTFRTRSQLKTRSSDRRGPKNRKGRARPCLRQMGPGGICAAAPLRLKVSR